MKAWAWLAVLPMLGSVAHAESLGDVARRERERREKKGQAAPAKVIREDELLAGRAQGPRGTFSPAAGSTTNRASANVTRPYSPSPVDGGDSNTEVDRKRTAARERLDASYEAIRETSFLFQQAVARYQECRAPISATDKTCEALLADIGNLAVAIGASMEDAEDAARQGWLTPGEVRDARQRYGMSHSFWDELGRAVRQYRR